MKLLEVKSLKVCSERREILHGVSIEVGKGETVVLVGPNGAGKSTLAGAVMGLGPERERDGDDGALGGENERGVMGGVTAGEILFLGKDITEVAIDERARRGIFMAWQAPVEVPGVSFREILPKISLERYIKVLGLSPFMLQREMNVGMSGGEKKKMEILQMMALGPKLAILDETDSGLDVDAARQVSKALKNYQRETGVGYLIVTHNARILQELEVNKVYVMMDGRVSAEGDGRLIREIEEKGFQGRSVEMKEENKGERNE